MLSAGCSAASRQPAASCQVETSDPVDVPPGQPDIRHVCVETEEGALTLSVRLEGPSVTPGWRASLVIDNEPYEVTVRDTARLVALQSPAQVLCDASVGVADTRQTVELELQDCLSGEPSTIRVQFSTLDATTVDLAPDAAPLMVSLSGSS